MKQCGAWLNEVEQIGKMLGKSEWDRTYRNWQKIETGRGSLIDVGQVELSLAKWMRGGASLKQGEANRNGLRPFKVGWDK